MKFVCCGLCLLAALSVSFGGTVSQEPSPDASWRNDFDVADTLDNEWKYEGSRFLVPRTKFSVGAEATALDGNVMIVEAGKSTGLMLTAPSKVDLTKTPVMRWRWRVVKPIVLKPGETEPDDQAVVVYFGDGSMFKQRSVGYRWEVNTALGIMTERTYAAGMMTVNHTALRNHTTPAGEWVVEERNVVEDYRKAYGEMPSADFVVSVGGNSQYTGSESRAEIDFIEFIPERKTEEAVEAKEKDAQK